MSIRTVRDKQQILRFEADVIATASSARPGVARWSELVVYRRPSGDYVIWKIGRSVLAHRPDCERVYPDMPTWLEAEEEAKVHRIACLDCQPVVGDGMDPQTILESTRYTVLRARDPGNLWDALHGRNGHSAQIVNNVINQLKQNDHEFACWLAVTSM